MRCSRISGAAKRAVKSIHHSPPLGPDDGGVITLDPVVVLVLSTEFQKLPDTVKALVYASPTATEQMAALMQAGYSIDVTQNLNVAARFDPNEKVIQINAATMSYFSSGDASDIEYQARMLISSISHEMGHAISHLNLFASVAYTVNQYVDLLAAGEARSMMNQMLISSQLEAGGVRDIINSGYGSDGELTSAWNSFTSHKNVDTLLQQYKDMVLNYSWSGPGAVDLNGDGKVNMTDKYIQSWDGSPRSIW